MDAYINPSIRVGASIQEQLNHFQMTILGGYSQRSQPTAPLLKEYPDTEIDADKDMWQVNTESRKGNPGPITG